MAGDTNALQHQPWYQDMAPKSFQTDQLATSITVAVSEPHNSDREKPDGPARQLHQVNWLSIQLQEHASSLPRHTVLINSKGHHKR